MIPVVNKKFRIKTFNSSCGPLSVSKARTKIGCVTTELTTLDYNVFARQTRTSVLFRVFVMIRTPNVIVKLQILNDGL